VEILEIVDRREAVQAALDCLETGEVVVVQADEYLPASSVEGARSGIGQREGRVA